jgi:hypothetical protein
MRQWLFRYIVIVVDVLFHNYRTICGKASVVIRAICTLVVTKNSMVACTDQATTNWKTPVATPSPP